MVNISYMPSHIETDSTQDFGGAPVWVQDCLVLDARVSVEGHDADKLLGSGASSCAKG